jgi:hypothetical protein
MAACFFAQISKERDFPPASVSRLAPTVLKTESERTMLPRTIAILLSIW